MKKIYNILPLLCALLLSACNDEGNETVYLQNVERNTTVTGIYPECGYRGEELTISGTDFGISGELVKVFIGENQFDVLSCEDEEIVVKVPDNATTGKISMEVIGTKVSTDLMYKVLGQPGVSKIDPMYGFVGDNITFEGDNFGTVREAVKVMFAGVEEVAQVVSCENEKFVVKVPEDAVSGKISLMLSKQNVNTPTSDEVPFVVLRRATLAKIEPAEAYCGSEVKITGTSLVSDGIKVYFEDKTAEVVSCTPEELIVKVPAGLATGEALVSVETKYEKIEAKLDFTVRAAATVTGLSVASQYIGKLVTITGQNFGTEASDVVVKLGDKAAKVILCVDDAIVIEVPVVDVYGETILSMAILGVAVNMGEHSAIEVKEAPQVRSVKSSNALAENNLSAKVPFVNGDNVIFTGVGFGTDASKVKVLFGSEEIAPSSVTAATVEAVIPDNFTGTVALKFNGFEDTFGSTELQQVKAGDEITEYILKNYKQPFVGKNGITSGWDAPMYWETNPASQNYNLSSSHASGFYINPNATGNKELEKLGVLVMQAGWDCDVMPNGKIWQTAALPAGNYKVELVIPESIKKGNNEMYFVVATGEASIPDVSAIASSIVLGKCALMGNEKADNFTFTIPSSVKVTIGLLGNLTSKESCAKVSSIKITLQ